MGALVINNYAMWLVVLGSMCCNVPICAMSRLWHEHKAAQLFQEKKYTQAKALYEQLVEQDPEYMSGLYNIGKAHYKLEDFASAQLCFEKVSKAPHISVQLREQALFDLGDTHMQRQNTSDARTAYESVLALNKHNTHAQKRLELLKKIEQQKQQEQTEQKKSDQDKKEKSDKNTKGDKQESDKRETEQPDKRHQDQTQDTSKQSQNNKNAQHEQRTQHDKKGASSERSDEQKQHKQQEQDTEKHNNTSQETRYGSSHNKQGEEKQQLLPQSNDHKNNLDNEQKQLLELIQKVDGQAYRGLIQDNIKQAELTHDEQHNW
jgi:Ca-activated chloride channel homolog